MNRLMILLVLLLFLSSIVYAAFGRKATDTAEDAVRSVARNTLGIGGIFACVVIALILFLVLLGG